MEDPTKNIAAEEGSGNLLSKFGELPGGVQRVIIAVLVIAVLIALMFIQRLIRTEKTVSEETGFMGTVETYTAQP